MLGAFIRSVIAPKQTGRQRGKILNMKKILAIIILGFICSKTVLAESIEDFEIEGMSIGDSLLKTYSEKDIKSCVRKIVS